MIQLSSIESSTELSSSSADPPPLSCNLIPNKFHALWTHWTGRRWCQLRRCGRQTTCGRQSCGSGSGFLSCQSRWWRWSPGFPQPPGSSPGSSCGPCAWPSASDTPAGTNRIISSSCRYKQDYQFHLQDQTGLSGPPAGSNTIISSTCRIKHKLSVLAGYVLGHQSHTCRYKHSYQFLAVRVRCKHNYQFLQAMHLAVRVRHTCWCKHNYLVDSDQRNLIFKPNQLELTELHPTDHCLKSKLLFLASHLKH